MLDGWLAGIAGWSASLAALEHHLDEIDPKPVPPRSQEWRRVHPGYVEAFGSGGSSVGPPDGWDDVAG